MPLSFMRTLRLKVRTEAYDWLGAAAVEVNEVFNYCNETSFKAATRSDRKRKWLSGFDLCNLTSGASPYFDQIGEGWGMLKGFLEYKSQQAARSFADALAVHEESIG